MARSNLDSGCAVRPKSSCRAAAMVARSASVPAPLSSASTSYCGGRGTSPATIVMVSSESSATVRPSFVSDAQHAGLPDLDERPQRALAGAASTCSRASPAGQLAGGRQWRRPAGRSPTRHDGGWPGRGPAAPRAAVRRRLRGVAAALDRDDHAVAAVAAPADEAGAPAARDRLRRGRRRTSRRPRGCAELVAGELGELGRAARGRRRRAR